MVSNAKLNISDIVMTGRLVYADIGSIMLLNTRCMGEVVGRGGKPQYT